MDLFSPFRQRQELPLGVIVLIAVAVISLVAWSVWSNVEDKVKASPYRCQSSAKAESLGCLVRGPRWIGTKFTIRQASLEVGEIWSGHDYNYVRSGLFSARMAVDPAAYFYVEFVGSALMREHIGSPLEFKVDGIPTRLMLCDAGSALRIKSNEAKHPYIVEVFEGSKKAASFTIELGE